MPLLIPTPDEVARMSQRDRAKWRKRMDITLAQANQTRLLLQYGEATRMQAKVWERLIGPDPDAARHQAELLLAVK